MYEIKKIKAGFLRQEPIQVVEMPRERFLGLVDGLLQDYPHLTEKLRPVAETMVRFPMGEWINPDRGCGCVVGEYLVATAELGRAALAQREQTVSFAVDAPPSVEEMVMEQENGSDLYKFGLEIDDRIRDEIRPNLAPDADGWTPHFDAVEIVD